MESAQYESRPRTFIGTVVFVDIVAYSKQLVSQQVEVKTRLNDMIARVLEHVPTIDRMTLDTGDGAALCFLGDPEDALFVASSLRAAVAEAGRDFAGCDFALRIGIHTGPLRIVKGVNKEPNVLGDGINVAQRIMTFAAPNQILVSRSYYEIVSRLSQEYARLFQFAGLHRDKHVREHEVYAVTGGEPSDTQHPPPPAGSPASAAAGVVRGEGAAPAEPPLAHRFDPAVLAQLEAALTQRMGPVARVIVRRAAAAAVDLRALCHALAESVPEAERRPLAEHLERLTAGPAPATRRDRAQPAPTDDPATPADGPGPPLSPDLLTEAADRLAVYIGPMAKVLVRQAAATAGGRRELYHRLARHIDDPGDRGRFLAAGVGSGKS
jgi:class 3 adenylate cyclase